MLRLLRFSWPLLLGIAIALALLRPAFAHTPGSTAMGSLVFHIEGQQIAAAALFTTDREILRVLMLTSTPILIPALLAGLVLSVVQTMTLIGTHALTFLPRLLVMTVGLVSFGGLFREAGGVPETEAPQHDIPPEELRKSVRTAQVVLSDPARFAVALHYDRKTDAVPILVAKGQNATALAIRELATEQRIPILTYPALTRAIYYTSREEREIRDDLYVAVATVLAFVFSTHLRAGGSPPAIEVPTSARFDEHGRSL